MASLPVPAGAHAALATVVAANRPAAEDVACPSRVAGPRATAAMLAKESAIFRMGRRNLREEDGPMALVARGSPMFFPSVPTSRRRTTWRHDPSVDDRCHVANSAPVGCRAATRGITEENARKTGPCPVGTAGSPVSSRPSTCGDATYRGLGAGGIDTDSAQAQRYRGSGHGTGAGCQPEPRLVQGHDDKRDQGNSFGHDLVDQLDLDIAADGLGAGGGSTGLSLVRGG